MLSLRGVEFNINLCDADDFDDFVDEDVDDDEEEDDDDEEEEDKTGIWMLVFVLFAFGDSNSMADLLLLVPLINGEARLEFGLINLIWLSFILTTDEPVSVLDTLVLLISLTLMSNGDLDIKFKSSMPTVGGKGAIRFLIESDDGE